MKEFRNGQKLKCVCGPQGPVGEQIYYCIGRDDCIAIEVVMENGQMAGVPWALIYINNKPKRKVNLALMEEVVLLQESEKQNESKH